MKKLLVLCLLTSFTNAVLAQNNLKGVATNSPLQGSEVKIHLIPPKSYSIKEVVYVLHDSKGKPLSKPVVWRKAPLEIISNKTIVTIPMNQPPGDYKAHIKTLSEKSGSRSVMVDFTKSEIKDVPHPGEEGEKTLLGIDVDKDGIRDDVQIWINQRYPLSSGINKALKQTAKYDQLAIQHHTEKEIAVQHHVKSLEAYLCLGSFFDNESSVRSVQKEYEKLFLNTPERIKAVMTVNSYRHGASMPEHLDVAPSEESKFCEFNK